MGTVFPARGSRSYTEGYGAEENEAMCLEHEGHEGRWLKIKVKNRGHTRIKLV